MNVVTIFITQSDEKSVTISQKLLADFQKIKRWNDNENKNTRAERPRTHGDAHFLVSRESASTGPGAGSGRVVRASPPTLKQTSHLRLEIFRKRQALPLSAWKIRFMRTYFTTFSIKDYFLLWWIRKMNEKFLFPGGLWLLYG